MKRIKIIVISLLFLWNFSPSAMALDGGEILKKSDQKIVPNIARYDLVATTIQHSGRKKTSKFYGFKKGDVKNIIIVKAPKKIKGSVHLRKGTSIWSYYTTNHRLQKFAYQSFFMGSLLSYGDVLSTELSFDYDVVKTEERENEYALTLKPKKDHGGYDRVEVFIDKTTLYPKKREYYALSGVKLKESTFTKIELKDDKIFYVEQEFFEPIKKRKTIVTYQNFQHDIDIPEKYYNENFLKHISGK